MDALVINGPTKLSGKIKIHGSKNCTLPLLFASLLLDDEVTFNNVPRLWDVETTLHLMASMGVTSHWNKDSGTVQLLPRVKSRSAPYEWVKKMRAGILALGPLVAKYGEAEVSLPGGCAIGMRPVDFHLSAMQKMGVKVEVDAGYIRASVLKKVKGAQIRFPDVTVTGTENILMLATLAEGETVIENAAKEPEVVYLSETLKHWGAKIEGIGSQTLRIQGGNLQPPQNPIHIPPDRIETGTWIAAAVATNSDLILEGCDSTELQAVLSAFQNMGVQIENDHHLLKIHRWDRLSPIDITTKPYPGFPTDMQAQLLVTMCLADGRSTICESIFENRFMHVAELNRLGASIEIKGNKVVAKGPITFRAAPLMATDLRASASLVIAALCAEGSTKISRIYHLDRGYEKLDQKLKTLGVEVSRVSE